MHHSHNVNFLLRIICQDGLKLTVFRVFLKDQLVFKQQLFDAPWANRRPERCRDVQGRGWVMAEQCSILLVVFPAAKLAAKV